MMDAGNPISHDAIRRAARGFEAALVRRMLEAMEKAQLQSGLFGGSAEGKTRQTTFHMILSEAIAETEPFGLAEAVTRQLGGEPDETNPGKKVRKNAQDPPIRSDESDV